MQELLREYKMDWKDVFQVVLGSFILALAFQLFLLPNEIISGGVSSLSIILYEVIGLSPSFTQYLFNIPLLVASFVFLGKDIGIKSVIGSLVFPFFTGLVSSLPSLTNDLFLASLFGGVMTGIGVGIVYRGKGSTGGTSTVAQLIAKYGNLSLGNAMLFADAMVILIGFFVFDLEAILYGIITLTVASRIIDVVLVGASVQKTIFIITDETEKIRGEILDNFDRGVTLLDGRGGYQNEPKEMMMVVIEEREITALREMIIEKDENAFVVVMAASEVMGRGFSLEKYLPVK
ncbi:MAG: YitT family protein [Atopostipes suicloacalis]|nr:YitT family protein [Atopostipes suicloacalis]